jgi:hypothetical protein
LGKERVSNPWFQKSRQTTDEPPSLVRQARTTPWIRGSKKNFKKNLKKSIDTLLRVQLKGALSPALAGSAAGELTTGKNKKSGKNRKKC